MAQTNNHARSKQKRKKLRLRNRLIAIHDRRTKKIIEAKKEKGTPVHGKAADHAVRIKPTERLGDLFHHDHARQLNQRQKRKRARAANRKIK